MIPTKDIVEEVETVIDAFSQWKNTVYKLGNQCAATDRMLEEAFEKTESLKRTYSNQFDFKPNDSERSTDFEQTM